MVQETVAKVFEAAQMQNSTSFNLNSRRKTLSGSFDEEFGQHDDSYEIYDLQRDETFEEEAHLGEGDLARAHWIQLHKTNKQGLIVQNAFIHILTKYKHIRPIWHFGKNIEDSSDEWKTMLYEDFYFRHHCASIQAGLTMVMENKDDSAGMRKLLNEIGAHHFFYDACEPHLDVFEEGIIESMKTVLHGVHSLDEQTEASWRMLLLEIKTYMSEGISIQRNTYLKQCMTGQEIDYIRKRWISVTEFGLLETGRQLCEIALRTYAELLNKYNINMPMPEISKSHENFDDFANLTISAIDLTIKSYRDDCGFSQLTSQLKDFVTTCLVLDVCPPLVRKSVMQGLINTLSKILGEEEMSDVNIQIWSKLYRVLEQAVIANIIDY
ncbi:unnamed protein product [Auanema sp. JU1783]|nr:unnamed protein product [Auanema sp. JU1783]